jgi:HK97 gp10 family phage protein
VFKGGHRPPETVQRGIQRRRRWTHQYKIFGRRVLYHTEENQKRFLKQVDAQRKPNREVSVPTFDPAGSRRVRGNPRSWEPVLRRADGTVTTGEYRRVTISGGKVSMKDINVFEPGATSPRAQYGTTIRDKAGKVTRMGTDTEFLSGRGVAELARVNRAIDAVQASRVRKTGRRFTDVELGQQLARDSSRLLFGLYAPGGTSQPQFSLGGRLRGEIYHTNATNDGGLIYADVISPTEYAKYQEYGTSRHRAQPYMRPALYKMRNRLPQIVKSTIRKERGK